MFPYRDDNPTRLAPVVTLLLIAANILVWIMVQGMGDAETLARSICQLGLVPGDLLQRLAPGTSFPVGDGMYCVVETGWPWQTLFSAMFLHAGWIHLLGNCWFLWLFGNNVEDAMGHGVFLIFYLACGLVAAATQVAVTPSAVIPMVGASGAISGVMGAYIILYPRVRVHVLILIFTFTIPAWLMLGWWFAMQVINAEAEPVGGVAVWAHIGGFLAGALMAVLKRRRRWV